MTRAGATYWNLADADEQALKQATQVVDTDADALAKCVTLPGGLTACFAVGTRLLTPEGYREISELRAGDLLLSRDESDPSGPVEARAVEEVFVRTGEVLELRVAGRLIRTTAEHPFYVEGRGWQPAMALKPEDRLLSHDGQSVVVESVADHVAVETVYNLRIDQFHTYFVSDRGWGFSVWSHNTAGASGVPCNGPAAGLLPDSTLLVLRDRLRNGAKIVLRPDTTYTTLTESHTATYRTDDKGRLAVVTFSISDHRAPNTRLASSNDTSQIGHLGLTGNIGFHIVGDQVFGSNYYPNLVPGSKTLNKYNSGRYGKLEALWKKAVENGKGVNSIRVVLVYPDNNNLRPTSFSVTFRIGSKPFSIQFANNSSPIDADTQTVLDSIEKAATT